MADIKKVIEKVITDIYKTPRARKMTYMANDVGNFKPVSSFKMVYDSAQNQLEPIYYWLLDFIRDQGLKVEKVVDNFTSSPGSGHFAEMGQRATRMQEEGMKILGGLNQTIKSALNLVYDLKEFKMRLKHYEDYREGDKVTSDAALLALKQVWLDSVDLPKRNDGSIHGLASKLGYTTIREAFMYARSLEDIDTMAEEKEGVINEQVARILKPRLKEFFDWIDYSEAELRKRYQIERSYLKSQIGTIKLYSAWVKPYLKAAEELRQKGFDGEAALVNAFSTTMFQLTLFCTNKKDMVAFNDPTAIRGGRSDGATKPKKRKYFPVMIVDFVYRGHLLQRANQRGDMAPAFGGRVEMTFDSYALNSEELERIKKTMEKEDMKETLSLEGDYAMEAIDELEKDFREFLDDDYVDKILKKDPSKKKKQTDDINPFAALASIFTGGSSKEEKKEGDYDFDKKIKPDNWTERQARKRAADGAASVNYRVYDIYKKAHGMASSPTPFVNEGEIDTPSTYFSDVWSLDWQ